MLYSTVWLRKGKRKSRRSYINNFDTSTSERWRENLEFCLQHVDHQFVKSEFSGFVIERQDLQEKHSETFLVLLSGGGLIFTATLFQGAGYSVNYLTLLSGLLLLLSLFCVAGIRAFQIDNAYFLRGEWNKNMIAYESGEISISELYWRTRETFNRKKNGLAILAQLSLIFSMFGYIFLALGLIQCDSFPSFLRHLCYS